MRTKVGLLLFRRHLMEQQDSPTIKAPATFENQLQILKSRSVFSRSYIFTNPCAIWIWSSVSLFNYGHDWTGGNRIFHISYHIAHTYGVLGHLQSANFEYKEFHFSFVNELEKEIRRSQEIFIKHHIDKYGGLIPVWVAVEVLSLSSAICLPWKLA